MRDSRRSGEASTYPVLIGTVTEGAVTVVKDPEKDVVYVDPGSVVKTVEYKVERTEVSEISVTVFKLVLPGI